MHINIHIYTSGKTNKKIICLRSFPLRVKISYFYHSVIEFISEGKLNSLIQNEGFSLSARLY